MDRVGGFISIYYIKNSEQGEKWFKYKYKLTCSLIRHLRVVPHKFCEYFYCSWCILVRFLSVPQPVCVLFGASPRHDASFRYCFLQYISRIFARFSVLL